MKSDSLLTLSYHYRNDSMTTLLTDISNLKPTCSCSTCTCSNNNDDYLAYAFIILYDSFIWCIEIIYELFFKSFWDILMYLKYELHNNHMDMTHFNKSISGNYPKKYSRYHALSQNKNNSSVNTQVILVPVRSSYCQTESDLPTINVNLNQSELINTSLHQPLMLINRELSFRTSTIPTMQSNVREIRTEVSPNLNPSNKESPNTGVFLTTTTPILSRPTETPLFSNKFPSSPVKSKQKQQKIEDNSIPLALATSLHSNLSICIEDYFLSKIINNKY